MEHLIAEHRIADELKARIFGDTIVYTDIENSILENNLYGVDINEDAIEIANLSLWLHTAKKGRKLSNFSNNVRCGNSLIDDASVVGDKACKWKEEFKSVLRMEGLMYLIGNPPYVFGRNEGISNWEKSYFKEGFITGKGK
ncbi:MAG: DNA methyltransferase [Ginsengibacter sp.]